MPAINRIALILLPAVLLIPSARAETTFNVTPSTISGAPGSTVGWGFSIFNDANYLVATSSDFTPVSLFGTYTDFIGQFDFIVVGPSPEATLVSQTFNTIALTGLGSYAISPATPIGSVITGQLVLTYDLYSLSPNDPNFDPDIDTISTGNSLSVPAQVNVGVSAVPEPASFGFVGVALLIMGVSRRARKRGFSAHGPISRAKR